MQRLILCLLGLVLFFGVTPARATVISGPITNPATGHFYFLLGQNSWTASEAEAITLGGHLATVNDAAEDSFIFTTFEPLTIAVTIGYWIGLNDAASEGTFVWSDGVTPVTYTNFAPGEPSNTGPFSNEDYVHVFGSTDTAIPSRSTLWNDLDNSASGAALVLPFGVVEIVPEPSTALLLSFGLAGLAFHGRRRRSTRT